MDGNGRWAEQRRLPRLEGHREGSISVKEVTRAARRLGLQALTLYAFSAQNWARSAEEVSGLMDLLCEYLEKERAEILERDIRLHAIGNLDRLPQFVRAPLDRLRQDSADNHGMTLTLALSYGGREELIAATQKLVHQIAQGRRDLTRVGPADFEACLWTNGLPELDLVIRTSGEHRISNFLLWQIAYAELVFVDTLWPDFRTASFLDCLAEFQRRERRFGMTSGHKAEDKNKSGGPAVCIDR